MAEHYGAQAMAPTAPPAPGHQRPNVTVYARTLDPKYANHYILRHARSIEADTIVARRSSLSSVHQIGSRHQLVGRADAALRRVEEVLPAGRLVSSHSRRLAKVLASTDVLYVMFLWSALECWPAVRATRAAGVPLRFVVLAAGSDVAAVERASLRQQRAYLRMMSDADVLLAGSDHLVGRLTAVGARAPEPRRHYIGTTVPSIDELEEHRRPLTLVAASRLVPVKGVDKTIESFARVVREEPEARLRIVGDGPLRGDLEGLSARLGVGRAVEFLGELSPDDTLREISRASLLVQHNVRAPDGSEEGLGGTILEAQARRVPVVVADSGGVAEALVHGETGLLVRSGDVEGMASSIVTLLRDPDRLRRMGVESRTFIETVHNARLQDERLAEHVRGPA